MNSKFVKNFSWMLVANSFTFGLKWLIVIVIAKFLSPNYVGEYSLAFAVTAPIALFAQLKLRTMFVTEQKATFSNFLLIRNFIDGTSFLLILLITLAFYQEYLFVFLLVGTSKLLDLKSELYYAIPHKNNDLKFVGQLMIIKNIVTFLSFLVVLIVFKNLDIALLIMVVVQLLILLFFEKAKIIKKYHIVKDALDKNIVIYIFKLSAPLGIVAMLFSFTVNIPRYVLEHYESTTILGYFSAILYILTVSNLFQTAISQVFLPKLSKLYNENKKNEFKVFLWKKLMLTSCLLGFIMLLIVFIFDKQILGLIYGQDYIAYSNVFKLSMIATFINLISGNLDTALISIRAIKNQPLILVVNLIITVSMSILLISSYGIVGAAITMIISSSILTILRYVLYKKNMMKIKI